MGLLDKCPKFNKIDAESKNILSPFFENVDYQACEYNFITMYMWKEVYNFKYAIKDNIAVIFGEYEDEVFSIAPLCSNEYLDEAFDFIDDLFKQIDRLPTFRCIVDDLLEYMYIRYKNTHEMSYTVDYSDYIYEAEKLRTLSGRKLHSKKNHYNSFVKTYADRYVYKRLDRDELNDCIKLLDKWSYKKEKDENLIGERLAIQKVFKNINYFPNLIVGGIYIDNNLEAFTYGDLLSPNMALIHIEKANPEIRGLYAAINKLFLENEFPNVTLVNREDDLGLPGLREAKQGYKPLYQVHKYVYTPKNL